MSKFLKPNAEPIPGYRLIRYLGRGGFGEVWEAEAPGGLRKAIKVAALDGNDAANTRELDGLQKMRSIRHPYLVTTERYEVVDGFLIIVMELADKTLADRFEECAHIGHNGIPRRELLFYMKETGEVLDLMNQQHGLQHLDIKPRNLFLSARHIKVADFGLVQPRNTNLNPTAIAISPPYAPPELFYGRIEPTADQYSLAVTYQELLTGYRPYAATDVRDLIHQHIKEKPEVSLLPACDRPIVLRALQRDASKRFESCSKFIEALREADPGKEIEIPEFGAGEKQNATEIADDATQVHDSNEAPAVSNTATISPGLFAPKKTPGRQSPLRIPNSNTMPTIGRPNTVSLGQAHASNRHGSGSAQVTDQVQVAFVAFLPIEIFAHKLRGFIDALDAEVISCTDAMTVLRFRGRGWFGFRSPKGVFLEIDTCGLGSNTGFRVVEATVWGTSKQLAASELSRRATILIQCLKSYLMATDAKWSRPVSAAEVRAELFS